MANPQKANPRFFPRYYDVNGTFPGKIIKEDGKVVTCKLLDVSRDGIGALLDEPIEPDSNIHLEILDKRITFRVVYCTPDLIHANKYRCGFHRHLSNENLINIFKAAGCIL